MPLLESVEVHVIPHDRTRPAELLPKRFWATASSLTEVSITIGSIKNRKREHNPYDDIFPHWSTSNAVPYHQLKHLILDGGESARLTWSEINTILSVSANLVSCFLSGITLHPGRTNPRYRSTTLHYLHLEASQNFPDDLVLDLASNLIAPSLRTLSLVTMSAEWEPMALHDFIHRSSCPLTELRIHTPKATASSQLDDFTDILKLLPQLEILHVSSEQSSTITKEFAEAMTLWDTETNTFAVCPNLQQFSFGGKTCPMINDNMVHILRARLHPPNAQSPPSFTKLAIHSKGRREVGKYEDLQAMFRDPYHLQIIDNDLALDKQTFHALHSRC